MRLLTPGPVPVPDFVLQAMQQPVIHHRSAPFTELYASVRGGLQYYFQTEGHTGTVIGSGTYMVEMAMYSLFRPEAQILVLDMGKFSERWKEYGALLGLDVLSLKAEWGKGFTVKEVVAKVAQHPKLTGIIITHSETSTGVVVDLEEMALAIKAENPEILLVVDAITSVGAMPFFMDYWQLDCVLTASQKTLLNPAGTAAYALSPLALEALRPSHPADFRNLYYYARTAMQNSYPYTAPVQLLYGLDAALQQIRAQTLPTIWNEVHQNARVFRQGLQALGGVEMANPASVSLTAFQFPGKKMGEIQRKMEKKGFYLAGGQGEWKGKILRISHFGGHTVDDMEDCLRALANVR